jgi:hypothetical protein
LLWLSTRVLTSRSGAPIVIHFLIKFFLGLARSAVGGVTAVRARVAIAVPVSVARSSVGGAGPAHRRALLSGHIPVNVIRRGFGDVATPAGAGAGATTTTDSGGAAATMAAVFVTLAAALGAQTARITGSLDAVE